MERYRSLEYEEPPLAVRVLDGAAEVAHAIWWFARQAPRFIRKEPLLKDEDFWGWLGERPGPKLKKRRRR